MNFLKLDYSLSQKSLDIYLSGCAGSPKCAGCHNPTSWVFDQGIDIHYIFKELEKYIFTDDYNMIKNIMVFGGEPLDQDLRELELFLTKLKRFDKKIWLFTRFDFEDVPNNIKLICDYIKTGRYIAELSVDDNIQHGIKLATSNQKIYKL